MYRKKGHPFYTSGKWRSVREAYIRTAHYVCEECGRPAEQVHHIDPLKDEDYFVNLEKCYGFKNLIALCRDCHNRKDGHFLSGKSRQAVASGYKVNMETGELEVNPPYPPSPKFREEAVSKPCEKLGEET